MGLGIRDTLGLCVPLESPAIMFSWEYAQTVPCSLLWEDVGAVYTDLLPALQPCGTDIEHGCEPQKSVHRTRGTPAVSGHWSTFFHKPSEILDLEPQTPLGFCEAGRWEGVGVGAWMCVRLVTAACTYETYTSFSPFFCPIVPLFPSCIIGVLFCLRLVTSSCASAETCPDLSLWAF